MNADHLRQLEGIRAKLEAIHNGDIADDEGNVYTFWEYISENVLAEHYIINGNKEYEAVELCITCGGPNIYINTRTHELELFWGADHETLYLPKIICDELDEIYYEFWNE